MLPWDVELRGLSIPVKTIPLGALLREGLLLSLVELCLEVLDELLGFSLFLELLPFSFVDCFNETLSHSVEYIGVLQVGLYDCSSRPRGHGGDGGLVSDGGAGEGKHGLRAVGVVPGAGVVFTEVCVDKGVGLREFVREEEVELLKPLLRDEFKLGGPLWKVEVKRFGRLLGGESSG